MIKNKVFYLFSLKSQQDLFEYDKKIQSFIDKICSDGHMFISINTTSLGMAHKSGENLRTQVTYKENYTRKVILEKNKNSEKA